MNVACTACPAKYAVPDDKVRGKRARITCKHCGTAILIDGTALGKDGATAPPSAVAASAAPAPVSVVPSSPAPRSEPTAMAASAPEDAPTESPWVVALSEDRQERASTSRIVQLFASGAIDAESYVWREGMSEWKTPFDVPELERALRAQGLLRFPPVDPSAGDDEATLIVPPPSQQAASRAKRRAPAALPNARDPERPRTQEGDSVLASRAGRAGLEDAHSAGSQANRSSQRPSSDRTSESQRPRRARSITRVGLGSPLVESKPPARVSSTPPRQTGAEDTNVQRPPSAIAAAEARESARAARRSARRTGDGVLDDLFAQKDLAGSEDDPSLGLQLHNEDPGHRMTGARNESSVLFSLDALIKAERESDAPRRSESNADVLVDPAASNLAAGVAGFTSLAAPDFTAPARPEPPPPARVEAVPGSSAPPALAAPPRKTGRYALYTVLLAGGALGTAFALRVPQKLLAPASVTTGAAPQAGGTPRRVPDEAPPEPAVPSPEATVIAPEPTPTASMQAAPPDPDALAAGREGNGGASAAREPSNRRDAASSGAAPSPEAPGERPATLADSARTDAPNAARADDGKPAEALPPDAPPFDKSAAIEALGGAASRAQSCKTLGGPKGSGQATVTFAPSGRVTSASVSGDFAGTAVGGCVARLFRSARVPAFSGGAVTVSKRFSID